jgi:hypothetical protein
MTPDTLFHAQKKGKTCISVIIPLQNKTSDKIVVEKSLENVGWLLEEVYPAGEIRKIIKALHELYAQIEYSTHPLGIGIYITDGFSKLVCFPFEVKGKIHIGESFWIKELLLLNYYATDYYVLEIAEKLVTLYKGKLNKLVKVEDSRFPDVMENHIEPVYISLNAGHVMVKDNKPFLKNCLLHVDNKLSHYLGDRLLIVAGPEKYLMQFHEITTHWTHIVGNITGDYSHQPLLGLEENAWSLMKEWQDRHKEVLANEWLAKKALHKLYDIREIWSAAMKNKDLILLVEKDYSLPVYQDKADGSIHMKPPHTPFRIITDVVNEIMRIVLEDKGEVILLENGCLDKFHHIVLLTS